MRAASSAKRGLTSAEKSGGCGFWTSGSLLAADCTRPEWSKRSSVQANDDLHLLGEELEPLLSVEEREAVRHVLALVPAGSHAHVDPPSGDVVDGDGHACEHAGMPERGGRDERAEPDPLGDRREPRERCPRVERVGVGRMIAV